MSKPFNEVIKDIVIEDFNKQNSEIIYEMPLIQYLVKKTVSANKGSKARSSFGSLYALYVLIEDYINNNFHKNNKYIDYEGAKFSVLYKRQRELPFGAKLQNHAFNNRLNGEFKKYFKLLDTVPIIRDEDTERYWINEKLLIGNINKKNINLANTIIKIIDKYIEAKQDAMSRFLTTCDKMKKVSKTDSKAVYDFIIGLLAYNVDARLFEIVSYSILKHHYENIIVYWGYDRDELNEENLALYKTGRTNANDGGIDFVMKPLGRFFQVTETIDFKKYFLDIDKVAKFPITFVVKTDIEINALKKDIKEKAYEIYSVKAIVEKYVNSIEELINIPVLIENFEECVKDGKIDSILDEIIEQSRVEFNV